MTPLSHNQPPHPDGPLPPNHELVVGEVATLDNTKPYLSPSEHGLSDTPILADIVVGSSANRQRLHVFDLRDIPKQVDGSLHVYYRGKARYAPPGSLYWVVDGRDDTSENLPDQNGLFITQGTEEEYIGAAYNVQAIPSARFLSSAHVALSLNADKLLTIRNLSLAPGTTFIETRMPSRDVAITAGSTAMTESVATPELLKSPLTITASRAEMSRREAMQASKDYSRQQISRAPAESQDRMLVDTKRHIYAVFDGLGGHEKGAEAAQAATDSMASYAYAESYDSEEAALADMRQALDLANTAVIEEAEGGGTTATVVRIANIYSRGVNRQFIIWGSVGDSRVYVANKIERLEQMEQLSKDEGEGHILHNMLGKVNGLEGTIHQVGCTWLMPGDRILIVSDGVTGDRAYDNIDPEVLQGTLLGAKTPEEAADIFVNWLARKIDDRSAIVIFANAKNNARSPATRT